MSFKKGNKIFLLAIASILMLSTLSIFATEEYTLSLFDVKLVINRKEVKEGDVPNHYFNGSENVPTTLIYKGTTYVPLKLFSEYSGLKCDYERESRTIYVGDVPSDEVKYLTDIKPYNVSEFRDAIFYEDYYKIDEKMTIGGKEYSRGLQLFVDGYNFKKMYYNLEGKYNTISGLVGMDDSDNSFSFGAPVKVRFYIDGELIEELDFKSGDLGKEVNLDVKNGIQLAIEVGCEENNQPIINFVDMLIE